MTTAEATPSKEKLKAEMEKAKKVQFIEPEAPIKPTSTGCQIVPGLLHVPQSSDSSFTTPPKSAPLKESSPVVEEKLTASPNSTTSNQDSGIGESGVSTRDQLNYLAQLIGFSVNYSDFPKGNHSEFLSLVTLSTDPPHMSHGSGSSVDESRDQAALKALSVLSELGLDNVKPKAK